MDGRTRRDQETTGPSNGGLATGGMRGQWTELSMNGLVVLWGIQGWGSPWTSPPGAGSVPGAKTRLHIRNSAWAESSEVPRGSSEEGEITALGA